MLHPWITECAPAQVPPFINMVGCVLTGAALLAFGTPEQRSEHLRLIITGERIWCQLFSEPGARHRGISFFLLDMSSDGVETRPLRQMNGQAEFDEVFLDEVSVPAANLLGPENKG